MEIIREFRFLKAEEILTHLLNAFFKVFKFYSHSRTGSIFKV